VFSWGHRTQRRMKRARVEVTHCSGPYSRNGGWLKFTSELKPSQNPLYGFWCWRMVARFQKEKVKRKKEESNGTPDTLTFYFLLSYLLQAVHVRPQRFRDYH
jgi:hypothetical protein